MADSTTDPAHCGECGARLDVDHLNFCTGCLTVFCPLCGQPFTARCTHFVAGLDDDGGKFSSPIDDLGLRQLTELPEVTNADQIEFISEALRMDLGPASTVLVGKVTPWDPTSTEVQRALLATADSQILKVDWANSDLPRRGGTFYFAASPEKVRAKINEIVNIIATAVEREVMAKCCPKCGDELVESWSYSDPAASAIYCSACDEIICPFCEPATITLSNGQHFCDHVIAWNSGGDWPQSSIDDHFASYEEFVEKTGYEEDWEFLEAIWEQCDGMIQSLYFAHNMGTNCYYFARDPKTTRAEFERLLDVTVAPWRRN